MAARQQYRVFEAVNAQQAANIATWMKAHLPKFAATVSMFMNKRGGMDLFVEADSLEHATYITGWITGYLTGYDQGATDVERELGDEERAEQELAEQELRERGERWPRSAEVEDVLEQVAAATHIPEKAWTEKPWNGTQKPGGPPKKKDARALPPPQRARRLLPATASPPTLGGPAPAPALPPRRPRLPPP